MVRHPGVRLGPEILDNHFLDMTIAAMQIADRHQRLDPFLSRLSNANQQAGRERHLCPARFLNGGEASGRSFIGRSDMGGSEERRGGKEGVGTCRSRWSPYN